MKIAILYICTGKYDIFWEDFYKSAEQHFLKNIKKDYFVFTDSSNIIYSDKENVHVIYQENLSWPGNTLFRFKMFKKIESELSKYDYIYFLNANSLFVDDVGEEVLTDQDELLVVQHPGFYDKDRVEYTYDSNPKSLACINLDEGINYVCGGFNGGPSKLYLKMINDLSRNIDIDYQNGVIALWHDESHINRYIINKKYKLLSAAYMFPEEVNAPFKKKVIVRDKNRYGGHDFLRGNRLSLKQKIKMIIKKMMFWR